MTPAIAPVTNLYCNGTMGSRRFAGAAFADIVTLKGWIVEEIAAAAAAVGDRRGGTAAAPRRK